MTAFFQSLMSCPIDLRLSMVKNICFCGGAVIGIPRFEQQFISCISDIIEDYENKKDGGIGGSGDDDAFTIERTRQFKKYKPLASVIRKGPLTAVYPLPFAPHSISWVGASVASLALSNDRWIIRKDLDTDKAV